MPLCRIDRCTKLAAEPSTLCPDHILRGKEFLAAYLIVNPPPEPELNEIDLARTDIDDRYWTNLYAVRAGEYVKFGVSVDIRNRFYGLQNGCPFKLAFIGSVVIAPQVERAIHSFLESYKTSGEWFRYEGLAMDLARAVGDGDTERIGRFVGVSMNCFLSRTETNTSVQGG